VILEGAPGIGKTRLASELVEAVRAAGGVVLATTCHRGEAGIAFEVIADLLRAGLTRPDAVERLAAIPGAARLDAARLVPALLPEGLPPPSAADDPGAKARLFDALAACLAALAAGPAPGLILVDDLQWADTSTLETLGYLARRPAARSLLLLLAVRREDLEEAGRMAIGSLERVRSAVVVRLVGLDEHAVAELVAAVGGTLDAAALATESEGSPLFVVEALAEPRPAGVPPAGVRALLDERIDGVGEVASQVLVAAAVQGRAVDVATLQGTSGRSEDETVAALEELVRRGIVRESTTGEGEPVYDLAHAILREVALERTSLARRRLLHRRAAETLRALPARSLDLARLVRIAAHERAAGHDREAALAHRDAGDLARSLYANPEAIDHFEAALALGHEDASALHEALGELRTRTGDYAGAVSSLERAAATAAPRERLASIERRLALAHQRLGDHGAAASHLVAALAIIEAGDPARSRLVAEQAVVALGAGDLDAARERASSVLAQVGDDPVAAAHAHRVLGLLATSESRRDDAEASLVASLELARRADDPGLVIAARNALALVAASAGDTPAALEHGQAALAEARRTGDLHLEAAVESNLADMLHAAGRDAESRDHQLRAVALFAEVGGNPGELQPEIWKLSAW
jgi:predicted ATPase